jgi:hypothetical protein
MTDEVIEGAIIPFFVYDKWKNELKVNTQAKAPRLCTARGNSQAAVTAWRGYCTTQPHQKLTILTMDDTTNNLSPAIQAFASCLHTQPSEPRGIPVPASHRHARGGQAGEMFSVVRAEMSRDWNTKVTKAHEIHERKPCRQADFRAFRGLSQLSRSKPLCPVVRQRGSMAATLRLLPRSPTSRSPRGFPVPATHRHARGGQGGEMFSVVRAGMRKDWNTKVTKAHEIYERKSWRSICSKCCCTERFKGSRQHSSISTALILWGG